jgi:hypothetical protein
MAGSLFWIAAIAVAILGFYVATYVGHRFAVPLGWDTPGYAWRTNLARAVGVGGLPSNAPYPGPVNPGRPGFMAIGGVVSALSEQSALRVAAALPAVMAAATGLAWFAIGRTALAWTPVRAGFLGLFVATSPFMVHAIGVEQYQDATIALAVASAAIVPLVIVARDGRALWPAAVLLAAAGTIHWSFLPILLAAIAIAALALLPASVRARRRSGRSGSGILATPSDRFVMVGVLAAAGAVVAIGILMPAPLPRAQLVAAQLVDKLHRDLPQLGLWLLLPLAAAGAIRLSGPAPDEPAEPAEPAAGPSAAHVFLWFALAWCEVTLLAVAAVWLFAWSVPAHRILAFCLPVPALAAVGLLWAGDAMRSKAAAGAGRWLAAGIAVVGLAASAFLAQQTWLSYHPVMRAATVEQAEAAAAVLDRARVPADRPIVFVVDDRGQYAWSRTWIAAHTIRASLPASRIPHTYFFAGDPADLLAGRPSSLPAGGSAPSGFLDPITYHELSSTYFAGVKQALAKHPVALMLASANPEYAGWVRTRPASVIAPGVALVSGELSGHRSTFIGSRSTGESAPLAWPEVVALSILALAVISFVGAGWSVTLLGRWLTGGDVAAPAPAVGGAMLVLGAIVLGRVGLRLSPVGAAVALIVVAAAGWVSPAIRRARRRR